MKMGLLAKAASIRFIDPRYSIFGNRYSWTVSDSRLLNPDSLFPIPQFLYHGIQILISPPRQIDQNYLIRPHLWCTPDNFCHRMGRLQGRNNPFGMAQG